MKTRIAVIIQLLWLAGFVAVSLRAQTFDLVIDGGRVIDPETNLDGIRYVGITGGKIASVSTTPLKGRRIIQAAHLIVAPGFIDLHQHGQTEEDYRLKALDGVTTALEMEIGAVDIRSFLKSRKGHAIINYGANASHAAARAMAFGTPLGPDELIPLSGPATSDPATDEQLETMKRRLLSEFAGGALGLGIGIQYTPGAAKLEIVKMFQVAASSRLPVYVHIRGAGREDPDSSTDGISEVIAASAITGASVHVAHINSSCNRTNAVDCLDLIRGARGHGIDITTEAYPYTAGMTLINSALFNPGWRKKFQVDYKDIAIPRTGERLTKQRFDQLRASTNPIEVVLYHNDQSTVDDVIRNPLVMIASDGLQGHPRNAGTYCRILARYVREQKSLFLMDAVRKMSFMPAQVLERSTRAASKKGRIQPGADADIVIFDPKTVADRATYASPTEPSIGMQYVLVAGVAVVEDGRLVSGSYPGVALVGDGIYSQDVRTTMEPHAASH